MCKEDVKKWVDELIRAKKEYNKIPAFSEEIQAAKNLWISIIDGADKVAEALEVPYEKIKKSDKDGDFCVITFSYGGFQFCGSVDLQNKKTVGRD